MRRAAVQVVLLALMAGPAAATTVSRVTPPAILPRVVFGFFATSISGVIASPPAITVAAINPDTDPTPNVTASVLWTQASGSKNRAWNLAVSAGSFSCPAVPASAVTVACTGVSASDGAAIGSCSAGGALSAPVTLASGTEVDATSRVITVNLSYTFNDSWRFAAGSCTLNLTYTVTAN